MEAKRLRRPFQRKVVVRRKCPRRGLTRLPISGKLRIPTKPAMHSERKPATDSDLKPAGIPI